MSLAFLLSLALLGAPCAGAARVYQSEHYDTEDQAKAALRAFKADVAAAGYKLAVVEDAQQVKPVGESFYFALKYDGFALPQPAIYSSTPYGTPEQAFAALRWFLSAAADLSITPVERGVRSRKDASYFWVRYLGAALPPPRQYTSSPYAGDSAAEGSLQACLGAAARAKSVVLEKDVRPSSGGPFYWVRYLGAELACAR